MTPTIEMTVRYSDGRWHATIIETQTVRRTTCQSGKSPREAIDAAIEVMDEDGEWKKVAVP